MNAIRFHSKEAFIEALEGRRSFWRKYDERQAREHQVAEQHWLAATRKALREALKWDYVKLSSAVDWNGRLRFEAAPKCPVLMEPKLDTVLDALKLTQGKAFTVDTSGTWGDAHQLLTWDPNRKTKVC